MTRTPAARPSRRWSTAARAAGVLASGLLPWRVRRRLLESAYGYAIAPSSRIGIAWIEADHLALGEGARIGHLNVFRRLDLLALGDHAVTGGLNWVASHADAVPPSAAPDPRSALVLGPHAALTARHYLDCTRRIEIGAFATVAGWRSVLTTRGVDLDDGEPRSAPIAIGRYCFVGSNCVVLPGAALPDHCVLGAGSLLRPGLTETHRLCAGSPARPIHPLSPAAGYFARDRGAVD